MSTEKEYDFVIIGSGMGGLVSSIVLALEGHSVLVLEKNHQIGGSLQVFSRDKCVFDTGVHYIGSLDKGENLYKIFKYLGVMDDLNLKRLDQGAYDMIRLPNGKLIPHGQGYDNFKEGLYGCFPDEKEAINQFCDKILEVCDYFPLYNLEEDSPSNYIDNPDLLNVDAWEFVSSLTNNEELIAVLLGNGPLYAGERNITPFYVVALITNSYIKGSYRLVNGGGQLSKLLAKRLRALGGDLIKHQEVVGANYEGKNVVSVNTADGKTYKGKNFISNIHPQQTIELFGNDHFRAAYKNRIKKLDNTIASFTVYLSFKENSFPYLNYNVYDYYVPAGEIWDTTTYDKEAWPQILFSCTPVGKNQGEYAESLSTMAYMDYSEVKEWEDSFNTIADKRDRGEAYKAFKHKKEQQVINRLEERFPGIRECIKGVYSSTPLTYRDYIGTSDGAMYGIRKNVQNILASKINAKTRIPNVYLTGQNIIFHGILGATIGALVTCFNFVNHTELVDKIKHIEDEVIS